MMPNQNDLQPDEGAHVSAREFAESVRALLKEDPRRYRLFGAYWYFVKRVLRRFYDPVEMPIIGDHDDNSVSEHIPVWARESGATMLQGAIDEYRTNASLNQGRNQIEDDNGEFFTLLDPDIDV